LEAKFGGASCPVETDNSDFCDSQIIQTVWDAVSSVPRNFSQACSYQSQLKIACAGNRITEISWPRLKLTGNLIGEVGKLDKLIKLSVYANNITGPIPPEIGSLKNLQLLWLEQNKFTGPIPDMFTDLVNLIEVTLSSNSFITGPIPNSMQYITKVQRLQLNVIPYLSGELPSWLGQLTQLRILLIGRNSALDGGILMYGRLDFLQYLNNLEVLVIGFVDISTTIPNDIWTSHTNLKNIQFYFTSLTGPIPTLGLSSMTNLRLV
jgi:Leucine-rich repeat (LRR) protein